MRVKLTIGLIILTTLMTSATQIPTPTLTMAADMMRARCGTLREETLFTINIWIGLAEQKRDRRDFMQWEIRLAAIIISSGNSRYINCIIQPPDSGLKSIF